ncbi:MAG: GMC family oxidoreductase N-terminal domain-containing protein [Alphaproteobacteria bacterium]|nr:GMC family oxidoreductase N-terminal domain-containing protein [Alphaproteobacteria bacterium]
MNNTYDYIIVGGGSAACVAAWRLTKETKYSVLLLERGPAKPAFITSKLLSMPAGWMMGISGSPILELHAPVPQKHLGGRAPAVGQAALLGGGTAVNAMVYTRGQAEDYDHWDQYLGQGSGWSYRDVLPHFTAMENNQDIDDQYHGRTGPLMVSNTARQAPITKAYVAAVQNMGIAFNSDFNGATQAGVGTMQYTTYKRRRYDGVEAFLLPALQTGRLTIKTGCTVSRVMVEKATCKGVHFIQNGEEFAVYADREVLLAAGCYNTPKILMLSGIGPAGELRKFGIAPKHDLAGVGQNLQDHHEVPVVAATNGHYGYYGEDKGLRALWNGLQYLLAKTGPVTSTGVEACAYIDPDGGARPTIKMYCVPTVYLDGDIKGVVSQDGVTLNSCLLRPKSRGTVSLRSTDPMAKPVIDNNYLADPDDLRLEIAGLRYAREILKNNPLAAKISHEIFPGKDVVSDADLAQHCRRTVKTNWHPVGTCSMGPDGEEMAVLDSQLCVRGLANLRVIDASAMPFIPSGNTNAPTLMLAHRAVSFMFG